MDLTQEVQNVAIENNFVQVPNWHAITYAAIAVADSLGEQRYTLEDGRLYTTERVCRVLGAVDFAKAPSGKIEAIWPHNWFTDLALTSQQLSQKLNG